MNYLTKNLPHYSRVPNHLQEKWEGMFWAMMKVEVGAYAVVPIIARNYRLELRTDTMKRRAAQRGEPRYTQYTELREYLPEKWAGYQTHDNACDELWWGLYDSSVNNRYSQEDYDTKAWLRYYNRVAWLTRNKAYGFSYTEFGAPKGTSVGHTFTHGVEDSGELWVCIKTHEHWFHYEAQVPTGNGKYRSVNIGWKANRSAPPLEDGTYNVMYANRLAWFKRKQYK